MNPTTEAPTLDDLVSRLQLTGDALDTLTIPELRVGNAMLSRQVGRSVDLGSAIVDGTEDKPDALAYVAWLHAKRHDHQAKLGEWTTLPYGLLFTALTSWQRPAAPTDQADQADAGPDLDDLQEAAEADPTEPTP